MTKRKSISAVGLGIQVNNILDANKGFGRQKYTLKCIGCKATYSPKLPIYNCSKCNNILDVVYEFGKMSASEMKNLWRLRRTSDLPYDKSGVWRYREFMPFIADSANVVTWAEGNTPLFRAKTAGKYVGVGNLYIKHQGFNPTGSFKDPGMCAAISQAKSMGMKAVVCASTGNTSASMAAYAKRAGMLPIVVLPEGQIAYGKLSQALDYGAFTIQIGGDFDRAMGLVMKVAPELGVYVVNSINPFRIEGQKTIIAELLEQLDWKVPDRLVVPGGNLGHASSLAKGLRELKELGFINKLPKITIVQAEGSNPLYRTIISKDPDHLTRVLHPKTLATAIKIGNPISFEKALRGVRETDGWITHVTEQEIADAKAIIGLEGIGCEPASAVTIAGLKKIMKEGTDGPIASGETVVAILTGNILKDPDYTVHYHKGDLYEEFAIPQEITPTGPKINSTFANAPVRVDPDPAKIKKLFLARLGK